MRDQAYKAEVSANVVQVRTLDLVMVAPAKVESKCLISKCFCFIGLFRRNRYVCINETPDLMQVSKG